MQLSRRTTIWIIVVILVVLVIVIWRRRHTNPTPLPGPMGISISPTAQKSLIDSLATNAVSNGSVVWIVSHDQGLVGYDASSGTVTATLALPNGWKASDVFIVDTRSNQLLIQTTFNQFALVDTLKQTTTVLPEKYVQVGFISNDTLLAYEEIDGNGQLVELNAATLDEHNPYGFTGRRFVQIFKTEAVPHLLISQSTDATNGQLYRYDTKSHQPVEITGVTGYGFTVSPDGSNIYYNHFEQLVGSNTHFSYHYDTKLKAPEKIKMSFIPSISTWGDNRTLYTVTLVKGRYQVVLVNQVTVTPVKDAVFDTVASLTLLNTKTLLVNDGQKINSINL